MIYLLSLYIIITLILAIICTVLWGIEIMDGGSLSSILTYAGSVLMTPLWPLFLAWVIYTQIADVISSLKGNYTNESE